MYEISLPKRQIVLTEKREAILKIYEDILTDCGIKIAVDSVSSIPLDAGEERKKGGVILSLLGAPDSVTDLVTKRTRELKLFGAKLDPIAYALYEEYVNYMTSALRKCGVSAANIQKEEIDDSLILISELFTRFVIQALRSDASIQCKRSAFIIALAKFADRLISENLLDSDRSEEFRVILIQTHIKWIKSLQDIVSFVEELNKPEDIVTANLNYLKVVEQQLTRHLILELVGQSKADGNWEGKLGLRCLGQTLERIEKRIVKRGEKILEKLSNEIMVNSAVDLVGMGIMTPEQNQRQRQVLLIKREQEEPTVEKFYQLLNKTRLIIRLVERISLLIKTSGWLPMVLNIIDLKAIDDVIQTHKITCEEIFEKGKGNSDAILKTKFGKELGRYNISLAYKHLQKVDRLTELENKDLLERIKQFILGDIRELSSLGEALGCYIVTSSPSLLTGDVPRSVSEFSVTPTKLEEKSPHQKKTRDRQNTKKSLSIKNKADSPKVQSLSTQSVVVDGYDSDSSYLIDDSDVLFSSSEGKKDKNKSKKETKNHRKTFSVNGRTKTDPKLPKMLFFSRKSPDKLDSLKMNSCPNVGGTVSLSTETEDDRGILKDISLQMNNDIKDEKMMVPAQEKPLLFDQPDIVEIMPKKIKKLPKKVQLNPSFLPPIDYMANFLTWVASNNPDYRSKIEAINELRDKSKPWFFNKFDAIFKILTQHHTEEMSTFLRDVILLVKEFDYYYIESERPFFRGWLWDVRKIELYYLKYFCLDAWENENDTYVTHLVSILKDGSRTAFFSTYNYLSEGFVAVWNKYIQMEVMAKLGGMQDQSPLADIDQRDQGDKIFSGNDERPALMSLDTPSIKAENEQVIVLTQKLEEFERRLATQHLELKNQFELEINNLKTTNKELEFSLDKKTQAMEEIEQKLSKNGKQITLFQKQLQEFQSENAKLKAELNKMQEKSKADQEMIQKLEKEAKENEQTILHLQTKLADSKRKSVTKLTHATQSESSSPTSSRAVKTKKLLKPKKKKHKDLQKDDLITLRSSDESSVMNTDSTELSTHPTSSGSSSIVDHSPSIEKQSPVFDSPLKGNRRDEVKKSLAFVERNPVVHSVNSADLGNPFN